MPTFHEALTGIGDEDLVEVKAAPRYYYVAHDQHWSYVTGLEAAYQRLAEYLGITADEVRRARRRFAGLIKIVPRAEARAAGIVKGRR